MLVASFCLNYKGGFLKYFVYLFFPKLFYFSNNIKKWMSQLKTWKARHMEYNVIASNGWKWNHDRIHDSQNRANGRLPWEQFTEAKPWITVAFSRKFQLSCQIRFCYWVCSVSKRRGRNDKAARGLIDLNVAIILWGIATGNYCSFLIRLTIPVASRCFLYGCDRTANLRSGTTFMISLF